MHVFAAEMVFELESHSLKEKRGVVKSILRRATNRFNVASAEVDLQDARSKGVIGFSTVSYSRVKARQTLENLERWIIDERPDIEILSFDITEC